jgi:hypothetical protein
VGENRELKVRVDGQLAFNNIHVRMALTLKTVSGGV